MPFSPTSQENVLARIVLVVHNSAEGLAGEAVCEDRVGQLSVRVKAKDTSAVQKEDEILKKMIL